MRRAHVLLAVTAGLFAACSGSEGPNDIGGDPAPRNVVVVDSIRYSAETAILESFPVRLRTTVTLTNLAQRTDTLAVPGGCPVTLRAYRDPARTGTPAWDQSQVLFCTLQIRYVVLGPGESELLQGGASATDILGDSLPDGRYYLSAVVRIEGETIELAAGSATLSD